MFLGIENGNKRHAYRNQRVKWRIFGKKGCRSQFPRAIWAAILGPKMMKIWYLQQEMFKATQR